ncbi:hypothetical protein HORIV_11900 [Vreelandella olivaria]|uniref:Uncharacterized protein n=1 Tax=Vreelandella olivaria TaxID=390919 RepID=A0ABM7GEH7_9GAMM|nr:hypothetical protein HORIV_11900 [Halomonas olivaria]
MPESSILKNLKTMQIKYYCATTYMTTAEKEACLDLAILCFNSARPEVAIECFKEVGPLFTYSPNEKKIIRREGSNKKTNYTRMPLTLTSLLS